MTNESEEREQLPPSAQKLWKGSMMDMGVKENIFLRMSRAVALHRLGNKDPDQPSNLPPEKDEMSNRTKDSIRLAVITGVMVMILLYFFGPDEKSAKEVATPTPPITSTVIRNSR